MSVVVLQAMGLLTAVERGITDVEELAREQELEKWKREAELRSRESMADMG
jgi:hypothetical protein